jgi:hypothetical protein
MVSQEDGFLEACSPAASADSCILNIAAMTPRSSPAVYGPPKPRQNSSPACKAHNAVDKADTGHQVSGQGVIAGRTQTGGGLAALPSMSRMVVLGLVRLRWHGVDPALAFTP